MLNTSFKLLYGTRHSVRASDSSHSCATVPLIRGIGNSMLLYVGFTLHSISSVGHALQRRSLHMQSFLIWNLLYAAVNILNLLTQTVTLLNNLK